MSEHNQEVEREELEHFNTKPAKWYGYIKELGNGAINVTTWLGTPIAGGRITSRWKVYSKYLTCEMVAFTVKGINGITYHGRGQGNGMVCNLRQKVTQ